MRGRTSKNQEKGGDIQQGPESPSVRLGNCL